MKVIVVPFSLVAAQDLTKPTIVIRALDSGKEPFPLPAHGNYVTVVAEVFDDITEARPNRVLFGPEQARRIIAGVGAYRNAAEQLLVHCTMGASRSPAVATALDRIYQLGHQDRLESAYVRSMNKHVHATMLAAAREMGLQFS